MTNGEDEEGFLMYAPADFEGRTLEKCLVDSGALVNVMPKRLATKLRLPVEPTSIKCFRAFDGKDQSGS